MKYLAVLAVLAVLSVGTVDAKKKKQRKCATIHKQVKNLQKSKLWRSCLIETCSLAGCGKCAPKKPSQACAEKAVDVIFVLDGSSSVGPKNGQFSKQSKATLLLFFKNICCLNGHHFFSSPSRKTSSTASSTSSM